MSSEAGRPGPGQLRGWPKAVRCGQAEDGTAHEVSKRCGRFGDAHTRKPHASTCNSGGMPSGIGGLNEVDTGNDCVQTYATRVKQGEWHLYDDIRGAAPTWKEVCGRSAMSGWINSTSRAGPSARASPASTGCWTRTRTGWTISTRSATGNDHGRPRSLPLPPRSRSTFNSPESCVIRSPVNVSTHTRSARDTAAIPRRCPARGLVQHPLGAALPPSSEAAQPSRSTGKRARRCAPRGPGHRPQRGRSAPAIRMNLVPLRR